MTAIAKPAATIMLGRDNEGELEILLLKRNKSLAFAGGLWVFPGGKVEANEISQSKTALDAAKLAAIRETKEEANIEVNSEALIFTRHWTTPAIERKRFATWFFFATVDYANSQVKVDDSEIKEHLWINPQKALEKLKTGELLMMPPTFFNLQLIRKCQSIAEVTQKLQRIKPIFIEPVMATLDGNFVSMYEGDAGHTSANPKAEGARHRLVFNPRKKLFIFEYQDCDEVIPVCDETDFFE